MAILCISEFSSTVVAGAPGGASPTHATPAPLIPPLVEQTIPIGGTSTLSAAFNIGTTVIMVECDVACSLAFGPVTAPPTAVATVHRMGAGETRFYGVPKGTGVAYQLAVIQTT